MIFEEEFPSLKNQIEERGLAQYVGINSIRAYCLDKARVKKKLEKIRKELEQEDGANIIYWEGVYEELGL